MYSTPTRQRGETQKDYECHSISYLLFHRAALCSWPERASPNTVGLQGRKRRLRTSMHHPLTAKAEELRGSLGGLPYNILQLTMTVLKRLYNFNKKLFSPFPRLAICFPTALPVAQAPCDCIRVFWSSLTNSTR
jgi:hypothetical protein